MNDFYLKCREKQTDNKLRDLLLAYQKMPKYFFNGGFNYEISIDPKPNDYYFIMNRLSNSKFLAEVYRDNIEFLLNLTEADILSYNDFAQKKLRDDVTMAKSLPRNAQALGKADYHVSDDIMTLISFIKSPYLKLNYPMIYNQKSDYYHIKSSNHLNNIPSDYRIYLKPKMENIVEIVKSFYNLCKMKKHNFYFKYQIDSEAAVDSIIIYSSEEDFQKNIEILDELIVLKPDLFSGCLLGKLWGDIGKPYGIAAEPKQKMPSRNAENDGLKEESYSSNRNLFLQTCIGNLESKLGKKLEQITITDQIVQMFKKEIENLAFDFDIDPDCFIFNLNKARAGFVSQNGILFEIYRNVIEIGCNDEYSLLFLTKPMGNDRYEVFINIIDIYHGEVIAYGKDQIDRKQYKISCKHFEGEKDYETSEKIRNAIFSGIITDFKKNHEDSAGTNFTR